MFLTDSTVASLISGLIGMTGALLGQYFGARTARQTLKMQQDHEDRTRFHADRLKAYAQFYSAAVDFTRRVRRNEAAYDTADLLGKTFNTLLLVASPPVAKVAMRLRAAIARVTEGRAMPTHVELDKFQEDFTDLTATIREELGVSAPST